MSACSGLRAGPFRFEFSQPTMDRWMYPFNVSPGCRPSAPLFGSLDDDSGIDSRQGQFLIGFDFISQTVTNCEAVSVLPELLATNRGPARYLLRRVRLTVTVSRDQAFAYDPTSDAYTTYLPETDVKFTPDTDAGRPVELFGVGYRNGWDAASFWEDSPHGGYPAAQRNAFAAGFNSHGAFVDVSSNVGKTNTEFAAFEVHPFAVGVTPSLSPGDLVPAGAAMTFDLNLGDPLIYQWVQEGLNSGRLRFMLTSLHTSKFGGVPAWPDFFTRDNVLGTPPRLEIEGALIGPEDIDGDGLPDDWERFHFESLAGSGEGDSDGDGVSSVTEFQAGTAPDDPASKPFIASIAAETSGCTLHFPYVASHRPVIERSADLVNWESVSDPVLEFYRLPGLVEWQDTPLGSGEEPRFYRLHLP